MSRKKELAAVPFLSEEEYQAMERKPKVQLTIRLDADILDWLKQQNGPYQTRINGILHHYMTASQKLKGAAGNVQTRFSPSAPR